MKVKEGRSHRKSGRPLSFDRNERLRKAMLLFWAHGYEATSLSDLTHEMAITPPSLYHSYGDKKSLFLESLELYLSGPETSDTIIANAETAKQAAFRLLEVSAIYFTGLDTPKGCMLATSAISCSQSQMDVAKVLAFKRLEIEKNLKMKIADGRRCGEFQSEVDEDALAGLIMSVIQGLSTLARDGAAREKLLRIVKTAMNAWPP